MFCILQLRLHPQIQKLKTRVEDLFAGDKQRSKLQVSLNYVTSRGPWYKKSWKFDESKSGGIASNIGIHFFDMLIRLFGFPTSFSIKENDPECLKGTLDCPLAQIEFCLSIRQEDLPQEVRNSDQRSWRQMMIDGEPFDFTNGFTDLHTKSYEEILAGRGFGLQEALPAVSLCESIRRTKG